MNTDKDKKHPRKYFLISFSLSLLFAIFGCSLPKIIVLHDPLSADEHVRLGGIYSSQGKTGLARDQYQAAVKQDKKHAKAWSLLGDASYQLKEYREAEKAYETALDLDPKSGDLHNNLAWVYVQQDRKLGKARELVSSAMALTPEHRPYYLDTLGVILLRLGKTGDAVAALTESVNTIPKDQSGFLAEAYLHLADAYAAEGSEERAAEARMRHRELTLHAPSVAAPAP